MKKSPIDVNTLSDLFFEFESKLQFFERKFLKEYGIDDVTTNEVKVLYMIGMTNSKSMSEIADKLKVTHGTLSITVNSLVKKGYVIRNRHKQDRRIIILYLTKKSLRVIKLYARIYEEIFTQALKDMSSKEFNVIISTLTNINQLLDTNFYEGIESDEEDQE